jgi:hypothetical protein
MPIEALLTTCLLLVGLVASAQKPAVKEIAFVSDTQAPMWIENVFLKANQNVKATRLIFEDIVKAKPMALYLLGDIVSLGYRNKKWKSIDEYIALCRDQGIEVHGLLGNHDLMGRPKRGEINFQKRFPDHVRTGFISIMDSIAVILVNSNFNRLTAAEINQQQAWYEAALIGLDKNPDVKAVIVTCHHAPYSNSKLVGSSLPVQTHFVPAFLKARKSILFITGHSHTFEHFKQSGKDFLVIGGGGGLHQPLRTRIEDTASKYKPMFHYLTVKRTDETLFILSHFLKPDFSGFEKSYEFAVTIPSQ